MKFERRYEEKVDLETGEIIMMAQVREGESITSQAQKEAYIKHVTRAKGSGFVFALYNKCSKYMDSYELKQADVARIIMLSTYMNYDGGYLMKDNNKTKLKKDELQPILRMKKRQLFNEFYNTMTKIGILIEENNGIKINNDLFHKGDTDKIEKHQTDMARLFINEIRWLYNDVKISDIKKLGQLFALIPYISFEHNVVCFNPEASTLEELRLMKLGDFAEIIGMKRKESKRLFGSMASIKLSNGEGVMGLFLDELDYSIGRIIINPSMIYRGNLNGCERKFSSKLFSEDKKNKSTKI